MRIAAIDIGGTAIKFGIVDENGILTEAGERPTEARQGGGAGIIQKVLEILSALAPFDRIGISTCGVVSHTDGSIFFANENVPGYTGTPLKKLVREVYPVPTAVLNDVYAAAVGEAQFGAGRGVDDFLCLTYGTGIGGAIFSGGKLLTGRHDAAGLLGHIVIHANDGKPCGCGGRGCYESYGSVTALCTLVKERTGENLNGRQIFARLDEPVLIQAVSDWTDEVATGLISLIQAFDPERVILGGGIFSESILMTELTARVKARLMPIYRDVSIVRAALGNNAGLSGAAYTAYRL